MSERGRERERKTSLGFNDISNIHADAFCCFVLSFSAALPVRVSSSPCAPAREREGQRGRTSKKTSGKKEEKTTRRTSKQAKTKAFLCVIKGVTYLSRLLKKTRRGTNRETAERKEQERTRIRGRRLRKSLRAHTKSKRKAESMRGEERGDRGR